MMKAQKIILNNSIVLLAILAIAIFSFIIPSFASVRNFNIIAIGRVPVGMFAIASLIPLAVGEFDISLSYMLGAIMMIGGKFASIGASPLTVMIVVMVSSILLGTFNGIITVFIKIPSTISTLATGMIMYSISLGINNGKSFTSVIPAQLTWLGKVKIADFNISIWVFLLTAFVVFYILEHTPYGKHLYEIGYSEEVVWLAGVKTKFVRFMAFLAAGTIIGLCGIILLTQSSNVYPSTGPSYLLPGLAVVFLSITMHTPGRYNIFGVICGTFFLGIVFNGINILGAPFWAESVINGILLLLVVLFASINKRR